MSAGPGPRARSGALDYCASATDLVLVIASVASVILGTASALGTWVVIAVGYLIANAYLVRHQVTHHVRDGRTGALDTLSWVFPSVAGLAGANAAFLSLVGDADAGSGFSTVAVLGVIGIPLSWLLIHLGFASIYASAAERVRDGGRPLRFPAESDSESDPGPVEFVYFALTIGATFATSDVEVRTRAMRLLVATHSVISFFYNAFVVAAAFQIFQRLAEG